jgi:hypothetical protein
VEKLRSLSGSATGRGNRRIGSPKEPVFSFVFRIHHKVIDIAIDASTTILFPPAFTQNPSLKY